MTKEEISKLSPVEAYNQAVKDCAESAKIVCVGDRTVMAFQNSSPDDIQFFSVDDTSILKNLISA